MTESPLNDTLYFLQHVPVPQAMKDAYRAALLLLAAHADPSAAPAAAMWRSVQACFDRLVVLERENNRLALVITDLDVVKGKCFALDSQLHNAKNEVIRLTTRLYEEGRLKEELGTRRLAAEDKAAALRKLLTKAENEVILERENRRDAETKAAFFSEQLEDRDAALDKAESMLVSVHKQADEAVAARLAIQEENDKAIALLAKTENERRHAAAGAEQMWVVITTLRQALAKLEDGPCIACPDCGHVAPRAGLVHGTLVDVYVCSCGAVTSTPCCK